MPTLTRRKRHHIWDIPKQDKAELKRMRLPWWGVLCVFAGSLPIYWLFDRMGRQELGLPVLACVAEFCILLVVKWRLRRYVWFWMTITVLAAIHIAMLCFVPWTKRWVPAVDEHGFRDHRLFCDARRHLCGRALVQKRRLSHFQMAV